jgi:hypothetical protein
MDIEELTKKIEEYHKEDIRRANYAKYMNLSYTLWAFTLATTSIAIANPNWATIVIAVIFLFGGSGSLGYSAKFKESK